MSGSGSNSEWIVDRSEHTHGYSYIRDHLDKQPKASEGPPFSKSHVGYINTDKKVLIVAGEVNQTNYPTNKFVLFGVDYWNIPPLAFQSVVPSWTYPIKGGITEAKKAADRLKTMISETDSALTGVSENNDMRLSIFEPATDRNESANNPISRYLTDYMISIQTEFQEMPWDCCECGESPTHESHHKISYHVLKSKDGYFYPYRYWCPEHPVSDLDELYYRIPAKEEAIDYVENFDQGSAEVGSDRLKKHVFYGTILNSGVLPIEKEYILRCDVNASHIGSSKKFVSIVNTTIIDERSR